MADVELDIGASIKEAETKLQALKKQVQNTDANIDIGGNAGRELEELAKGFKATRQEAKETTSAMKPLRQQVREVREDARRTGRSFETLRRAFQSTIGEAKELRTALAAATDPNVIALGGFIATLGGAVAASAGFAAAAGTAEQALDRLSARADLANTALNPRAIREYSRALGQDFGPTVLAQSEALAQITRVAGLTEQSFRSAGRVANQLARTSFDDLTSVSEDLAEALQSPANAAEFLEEANIQVSQSFAQFLERAQRAGEGAQFQTKFLRELEDQLKRTSKEVDEGLIQDLKDLGTAFFDFAARSARTTGLLEDLEENIDSATKSLRNAAGASRAWSAVLRGLGEALEFVIDNGRVFLNAILLGITARLAGPVLRGLSTLSSRITGVATAAAGAVTGRGISTFTSTLRKMPGTVGLVVGALATLGTAFANVGNDAEKSAEKIDREIREINQVLEQAGKSTFEGFKESAQENLEIVEGRIESLRQRLQEQAQRLDLRGGGMAAPGQQAQLEVVRALSERLTEQAARAGTLRKQITGLTEAQRKQNEISVDALEITASQETAFRNLSQELQDFQRRIENVTQLFREGQITREELVKNLKSARESFKETGQRALESAEQVREFDQELQAVGTDSIPVVTSESQKAAERLREMGFSIEGPEEKMAEFREEIKRLEEAPGIEVTQERLRELREEARGRFFEESEFNRQIERMNENIQDAFADTFEQVFDEGISGFEDFGDRILDLMKQTAAEMAAVFTQRAIFGEGGLQGVMRGGQGGGGISSFISQMGGLFGGGGGGTPKPGTNFLNKGFGGGGAGAGGLVQGGLLGAKGLLGGTGAGLGGFGVGQSLSETLGIGGGLGGSIGGALGGGAGFIFGGPVGAGIGSALGSVLGNAIGEAFSDDPNASVRIADEIKSTVGKDAGDVVKKQVRDGLLLTTREIVKTGAEAIDPVKGPLGQVGLVEKELDKVAEDTDIERQFAKTIAKFDEAFVSFLTDSARKSLKGRAGELEFGEVDIGKKLEEEEVGAFIATRIQGLLKGLGLGGDRLPDFVQQALDENLKPGQVERQFAQFGRRVLQPVTQFAKEFDVTTQEAFDKLKDFADPGETVRQAFQRTEGLLGGIGEELERLNSSADPIERQIQALNDRREEQIRVAKELGLGEERLAEIRELESKKIDQLEQQNRQRLATQRGQFPGIFGEQGIQGRIRAAGLEGTEFEKILTNLPNNLKAGSDAAQNLGNKILRINNNGGMTSAALQILANHLVEVEDQSSKTAAQVISIDEAEENLISARQRLIQVRREELKAIQQELQTRRQETQDRISELESRRSTLVDQLRGVASEAEKSAEKIRDLQTNLRQFAEELPLQERLSPRSPGRRLGEARQLFNQVVQRARGGSTEALGRVQNIARQVLEAGTQFLGTSTSQFQDVFQNVRGRVQALADNEDLLSPAERRRKTAEKTLEELGLLRQEQTRTVDELRRELTKTDQQIATERLQLTRIDQELEIFREQRNLQGRSLERLGQQARSLQDQISRQEAMISQLERQISATEAVKRAIENLEGARRSARRERAGGSVPSRQRQIENILVGDIPLPAMANGGIARGGMTLVGERGPELVNLPAGSRVTSNEDLDRRIREMGRGTGGSTAAAETAQLRERIDKLIEVTAAAGMENSEEQERLLDELKRIRRQGSAA